MSDRDLNSVCQWFVRLLHGLSLRRRKQRLSVNPFILCVLECLVLVMVTVEGGVSICHSLGLETNFALKKVEHF